MSADALLSRLDKVKRTGPGRWVACCSAHADRRPSLAVRELGDGRTLLHCFAQCPVEDVLGAVGLDYDALFPERPVGDRVSREARPFPAADILRCCAFEVLLASTAAATLSRGQALAETDRARLVTASARLARAVEMIDAAP